MDHDLVIKLAKVMEEKQAIDISILDIAQISPMADYFVIATAKNERQLDALKSVCDEYMTKNGQKLKSIEGTQHADWVLMDFGDVIIHLFSEEKREYYDLDRIWRDAEKIN